MKKLIIFLFVLIATIGYAQQKPSYRISYKMILNFNSSDNLESVLKFNNNSCYFQYHRIEENTDKKDDSADEISADINDTTSVVIYTDRTSKTIYETVIDPFTKKHYLIKEQLDTIQWNITNETKKVGTFSCNKATCRTRGRNYTAWFTFDVPGSFGPWKLHGLPGIIIEANDDKNEVFFYAQQVNDKNIEIEWTEPEFENITRKEYTELISENYTNMMKKLISKSSQRFNISLSAPKRYSIEIDEE